MHSRGDVLRQLTQQQYRLYRTITRKSPSNISHSLRGAVSCLDRILASSTSTAGGRHYLLLFIFGSFTQFNMRFPAFPSPFLFPLLLNNNKYDASNYACQGNFFAYNFPPGLAFEFNNTYPCTKLACAQTELQKAR